MLEIDKEIIKLSWKEDPKVLFLPTATQNKEQLTKFFKRHYKQNLGVSEVKYVWLKDKEIESKSYVEKINWADIIYISWGDSQKMMNDWKAFWVDKLLKKAKERGVVIAWYSAGGIASFAVWNSDSAKEKEYNWYGEVEGLGFINAYFCPHYSNEEGKKESLKEMLRWKSRKAVAVDDNVWVIFDWDERRVVKSSENGKAYECYFENWEYFEKIIS